MSKIESYKQQLNPQNLNLISGEINSANLKQIDISLDQWAVGPLVIAEGKNIPQIDREALVLFDSIELRSKVRIEKGAGVRGHTIISGDNEKPAVLSEYSIAMDKVTITGGYIGKRSGIAHGSSLDGGALGNDSFGNIQVHFGKGSVLPDGTYAFPLWNQPDEVKVPSNALYIGDPEKPRALNLGILNTTQKEWYFENNSPDPYPWTRPIMVDGPEDPRLKYILTVTRYNVDPFKRGDNKLAYDGLPELGVDRWLKESLARPEIHEVTRARWFHNYVPIRQVIKNEVHLKEDSQRFGAIVWETAQLQSEILHISRLGRILEASGNDASALKWLAAAQAYLLGIYQPRAEEIDLLERAFVNGHRILEEAIVLARSIPADQRVIIHAHPQETVNSLFLNSKKLYNGHKKIRYFYDASDIDQLLVAITPLQEHLAETALKIADLPEFQQPAKPVGQQIAEVQKWILAVNPNAINSVLHDGGNRIHKYHALVPIISDDAVLVNSDLAGAVVIGSNARLLSSSARSEQSVAPGYVDGTIELTTLHTATNEQEPFFVHKEAVVINAQVHGAEVNGYIADAVVADQSAINGIVAPDSLLVKRSRDGWTYHIGNFAESFSPEKILQNEKFINWWGTSPFKHISPDNVEAVQARVAEIKQAKNEEVLKLRDAKVAKYGEIYRLSPLLQADTLQLENAASILKQNGNDDLAQIALDLKEGVEAILGNRASITASQAAVVLNSVQHNSLLNKVIDEVNNLADIGNSVKFAAWPAAEFGKTYENALALVRGGKHPLEESDLFQFNYNLTKDDFTSEEVIAEQLKPEVNLYPEQLKLIARQLERIPQHIAQVREVYLNSSRGLDNGQAL